MSSMQLLSIDSLQSLYPHFAYIAVSLLHLLLTVQIAFRMLHACLLSHIIYFMKKSTILWTTTFKKCTIFKTTLYYPYSKFQPQNIFDKNFLWSSNPGVVIVTKYKKNYLNITECNIIKASSFVRWKNIRSHLNLFGLIYYLFIR